MSRKVTLLAIRNRVRQMADIENSEFITDSEINGYINTAITELYDMLVSAYGDEWAVISRPTEIAVTGSTYSYTLPSGVYRVRAVDRASGSGWKRVPRVSFRHRNDSPSDSWGYRLVGNNIMLFPTPASNTTMRLWYIPAMGELSSDSATLDGVSGWEEFVVVDAAIKCILKAEEDPSALMLRKAELTKRIQQMADERDISEPDVIHDVRGGWSLSCGERPDWGDW